MINNVVLVGRITKDPEVRYTTNNIATCSFTLACDRRYSGANGENQADFINCVAWRQSAEFMGKYIKKGYVMGITGSIQTRSYQGQDGQTRYVTEVVCDSVRSLQGRSDSEASTTPRQTQTRASEEKAPETFNVSDVADDDLPF